MPALRVFIVGPSSTGKTTLCEAVARQTSLPADAYVKEVARTVMRETGFSRDDVGNLQMQLAICNAQLRAEQIASNPTDSNGHPILLSDRSAIDAVVYAILTAADEQSAQSRKDAMLDNPLLQDALSLYRRGLFVLLEPVSEWLLDDGVRSMDEPERCLSAFKDLLSELKIPYHSLGRNMLDLKDRVQWVMELMDKHNIESASVAMTEVTRLESGRQKL